MNQQTEQRICLFHQRKPEKIFPGCGCSKNHLTELIEDKFSDWMDKNKTDLLIFDEASDVPKEMWDI